MISVLVSSSSVGRIKLNTIKLACVASLRSKSKDSFTQRQDNVSERSHMRSIGMLFQ